MRDEVLARRYALAVFELSQEQGALAADESVLGMLGALWSGDDEIRQAVVNPSLPEDERRRVLDAILSRIEAGGALRNFVGLLFEKGRIDLLPEIAGIFSELKELGERTVTVTVTSARELDGGLLEELRKRIASQCGREVRIETNQDTALLGGAVVRVGDRVLDSSVKGRLERVRAALRTR